MSHSGMERNTQRQGVIFSFLLHFHRNIQVLKTKGLNIVEIF